VLKKLLTILKLQDKCKINIANYPTKDIWKQIKPDF